MNIKPFLASLVLVILSARGNSQTVYHFNYNFHGTDTLSYDAIFVKSGAGGFARIRYRLPGNTAYTVTETDIEQLPVTDPSGMADTGKILFSCTNPKLVMGDAGITSISIPSFLFQYNPSTDYIEPVAVLDDKSKAAAGMDPMTSFTTAFMSNDMLTKNFLLAYFRKEDPIYLNLFGVRTRGSDPAERNTKLYLLIVANTREQTIGEACRLDKERSIEVFSDFADYLGIKMVLDTIAGENYNKKNVEKAIRNLKPTAKDIVIFYYSGHGYRKSNEKRRFPFIDLRAKPSDNYLVETLNMEDIYRTLQKKGARLTLVLSDCCNSDVEAVPVQAPKPFFARGSGVERNDRNTRMLFLPNKPVAIIATAAESGQRASCNKTLGGFFSFYLRASIDDYCSSLKENPSWQSILADTKVLTTNKAKLTYCDKPYIPANICQQFPDYIIK